LYAHRRYKCELLVCDFDLLQKSFTFLKSTFEHGVVGKGVMLCCPVYVNLFWVFFVWCVRWLCTPWISVFISRRLWEDVFPWLLVIMFLGVMGRTWKPCAAQIKTNKEMMGAPLSLH